MYKIIISALTFFLIVSNIVLHMNINDLYLELYELDKKYTVMNMSDGEKVRRAIPKGDIETFKKHLNSESVNGASDSGVSALHVAVISEQLNMINLLLEAGANVNAVDYQKVTPLHIAVEYEMLDIINLLLDSGANVNATTSQGLSILHMAVKTGNVQVISLILAREPLFNVKDINGVTPEDLALKSNNSEIIALFNKKEG